MQTVSIIITCFNSQETIERAVKRALNQDWINKEIIIVDDCSTDSSLKILEKLASKEANIFLSKHKKNKGYPAALNTAINKSKGEFIAIFDDDDDNSKDRISRQVQRITEYEDKKNINLILCYSNRKIYKNNSKKYDHIAFAIGRKSPEPNGIEVADYLFGLPVNKSKVWGMFGSCTLMARKSVFLKIGKFDESFRRTAEWDFAIRAAFKDAHFISVNRALIKMHKTSGADKAGLIPLMYSLKLRDKYKNYLEHKKFYNASKLIARSNFHFNKKNNLIGFLFRFLAMINSPIVFFEFFKIRYRNLRNLFFKV